MKISQNLWSRFKTHLGRKEGIEKMIRGTCNRAGNRDGGKRKRRIQVLFTLEKMKLKNTAKQISMRLFIVNERANNTPKHTHTVNKLMICKPEEYRCWKQTKNQSKSEKKGRLNGRFKGRGASVSDGSSWLDCSFWVLTTLGWRRPRQNLAGRLATKNEDSLPNYSPRSRQCKPCFSQSTSSSAILLICFFA